MAESTGMVIPKAASTGVVELQNIDLTSSSIEVMLVTFFNFSISKINDENAKIIIHKLPLIKGKEMDFIHLTQNIYILKLGDEIGI